MHLYILTVNRPKFHVFVVLDMFAVQFGHFGMTYRVSKLQTALLIYHFHDAFASISHMLLAKRAHKGLTSDEVRKLLKKEKQSNFSAEKRTRFIRWIYK